MLMKRRSLPSSPLIWVASAGKVWSMSVRRLGRFWAAELNCLRPSVWRGEGGGGGGLIAVVLVLGPGWGWARVFWCVLGAALGQTQHQEKQQKLDPVGGGKQESNN